MPDYVYLLFCQQNARPGGAGRQDVLMIIAMTSKYLIERVATSGIPVLLGVKIRPGATG